MGLTLPGLGIPLIGENGLLHLGDVGALGSYSSSPHAYESTSSTGLVNADGSISLGDPSDYGYATVDLTQGLGSLGLDTSGIIDGVSLELGALSSRAHWQAPGDPELEYDVAGARLALDAPILGDLVGGINDVVGTVDGTVNGALGSNGAIQSVLDDLGQLVNVNVAGLLRVGLGQPQVNANVNLSGVTDHILDQEWVSDTGLLSLDLSTGQIFIDVAQLHGGDLNNLEPNTSLLTTDELEMITQELTALLDDIVDEVLDAVEELLMSTEITIHLDPSLSGIGGLVTGNLNVSVTGTLAQFTGVSDEEPTVNVSGGVGINLGLFTIPVPLGDILGAIAQPLLQELVPAVAGPLTNLVTDTVGDLSGLLNPVVGGVLDTVSPVLDEVVTELVDVRANVQPHLLDGGEGDLGPNSVTVRALEIEVLPLLGGAVTLPLASSSARVSQVEPEVTVEPDSVAPNEDVTISGTGWYPGNSVTVTITDEDGNVVDEFPMTIGEDGTFEENWTVPGDMSPGDLTITVTDDELDDFTDSTTVSVTPEAEPSLSIGPEEVAEGDPVTIEGSAFEPGSTVEVDIIGPEGDVVDTIEVTVGEDGTFTEEWTVPEGAEPGSYTVVGTDIDDDSVTAEGEFTVVETYDPSMTVAPSSVAPGEELLIEAAGYPPNTTVTVEITDPDGNVIDTITGVETGGDGTISVPWTVPTDVPHGTVLTVTGTDDQDDSIGASGEVTVEYQPSVEIDQDQVIPGGVVDVTGSGYPPNSTVVVEVIDEEGNVIGTTEVTTDEDGAFEAEVEIDEDAPAGSATVTASSQDNPDITAESTVTVVEAPEVSITPGELAQGEEYTMEGSGWTPGSSVNVILTDDEGNVIQTIPGVTVNEDGTFTVEEMMPDDAPPGTVTVHVEDSEDPGFFAETDVTVTEGVTYDSMLFSDPDVISPGETLTLTGEDFRPGSTVQISVTDADGQVVYTTELTVSEDGTFEDSFELPEDTALGELVSHAWDVDDDRISVESIANVVPAYTPELSASPSPVLPGDSVQLDGTGFAPGSTVSVDLVDEDGNVVTTVTGIEVGEDGSVSYNEASIPEGAAPGEYSFVMTDEENPDITASAEVTVEEDDTDPPSASAEPGEVPAGETVHVTGENWDPDTTVSVGLYEPDEDGELVQVGIIEGVPVNEDGTIDVDFEIPADASIGDATIVVADENDEDNVASTPITITEPVDEYDPAISVEPGDVQPGDELIITGEDFEPGTSVVIEIRDEDGNVVDTIEVSVGEDGSFTEGWTVPEGATPGSYDIVVVDPDSEDPLAEGGFTVTEPDDDEDPGDDDDVYDPNITIGPGEAGPGDTVSITGEGFPPGSTVTVEITDADGNVIGTVDGVTADEDGNISTEWTVPEDAEPGTVTVTVTDDEDPDISAVGGFVVTEPDDDEDPDPDYDPAVTITPGAVTPGETVTVTGEDFVPGSTVTIVVTDGDGNIVSENPGVTVDDNGSVSFEVDIPEDAAIGNGSITITDDENPDVTADAGLVIQDPDDEDDPVYDPTIAASPDGAAPGENIYITGEGFPPGSTVYVTITDEEGNIVGVIEGVDVDEDGNIQVDWTVLDGIPAGELTIEVIDESDPEISAGTTVTITDAPDDDDPDAPSVEISPSVADPGQTVTITGEGFEPGASVTVEITDADGNVVGTIEDVTADDDGNISTEWTVPDDVEPGQLTVTVTDDDDPDSTASTGLVVTATEPDPDPDPDPDYDPALTISPGGVLPGESVTVTGEDFVPGSSVTVEVTDGDGNVIAEVPGVVVDENGGISVDVPIPEDAAIGNGTVTVTDDETPEINAEAGLVIQDPAEDPGEDPVYEPSITVSPGSAGPGNTVTITGEGYPPGSTVTVEVTDADGNVIGTVDGIEADEDGNISTEWTIPDGTAPGDLTVTVTDDQNPDVEASAVVTVTEPTDDDDDEDPPAEEPSLNVPTDAVEPGDTIEIDGNGFEPGSSVDIEVTDGEGNVIDTVEVPVGEDGNFTGEWTVPEGTEPGELTVTATDTNNPDLSASGTVTVGAPQEDDPEQPPADDPPAEDPPAEEPPAEDPPAVDGPSVEEPSVTIPDSDPAPGEPIVIEGDGFEPGQAVTVEVTDEAGNVIDTVHVTADDDGRFSQEWTVPSDIEPGQQLTITATADDDPESSTSTTVTVADPGIGDGMPGPGVHAPPVEDPEGVLPGPGAPGAGAGGLAVTGVPGTLLTFGALSLLLMLFGAGALLRSRRKRGSAGAASSDIGA